MNPFSVTDLEYTYFRWFGIIVGTFDIIVGGIGNGLTIAAFASNSRLRNTFNIFIINLSMFHLIATNFHTKIIFRPDRFHDSSIYDANERGCLLVQRMGFPTVGMQDPSFCLFEVSNNDMTSCDIYGTTTDSVTKLLKLTIIQSFEFMLPLLNTI